MLLTAPRGGSTAAPDKFCAFVSIDSVVWRIIQRCESGCQRSLAFGFCQFLAVLGIFSNVAVNSLRVRRRSQSTNLIAKNSEMHWKMIPKSIKIHAKSIQNQPKWCQGVLRKRPWEQVGSRLPKKALRLPIKFRLLAPLVRFWAPFWAQLGAKGLPKSSILVSRRAKMLKNEVKNEASKKVWIFDWI